MTVAGALAGLTAGVAIVAPLALSGHDPFLGINAGLLGLVVNLALNVAVSRAGPADPAPARFRRDQPTVPASSPA